MGSWANSLHVRHNDPATVAASIRDLLVAGGYEADIGQRRRATASAAADETPARFGRDEEDSTYEEAWDDPRWGEDDDEFDDGADHATPEGPSERRVVICQPVNGWVGVLDNAGLLDDLGERLSAQLKTDSLLVYVNDSDSWGYELRSGGQSIRRFDSSGDPDGDTDFGGMSPELQAAIEREDEAETARLMEQVSLRNAPQGPIVFHDGRMAPPPAMALLGAKIREGRGTLGDRFHYAWLWLKFQARRFVGWLFPSTLAFGYDVPHAQPMGAEVIAEHARSVRAFFPQADVKALEKLLPQSRFPAEDLLRDFLTILGLPPLYAYLSYDYREDFGAAELAEQGIVEVEELRYVR